jgi:hypothetical protein
MPTIAPDPTVRVPAMAEATSSSLPSAVDWAAIIAGGVLAAAISFILLTFGSAIGLSLTSPYEGEGHSLAFLGAASGLWVVWVQVSSFIAGAYLAGRLRRRLPDAGPHEVEVRDGAHGLLVWAIGVLLGAMFAASVATGVASTAASAVSTATQAVGSGAAQLVQSANPMAYAVDTLFRSNNPQAPENAADSAAEAGRILARSMAQGSISAEDKSYLAQLIATRTGLPQPEAEQRIDKAIASIKSAADEAKAAADKVRRATVLVAFVTAASLVVSAAAAWWAAGMGGRHRDEGTDFSHLVSWR